MLPSYFFRRRLAIESIRCGEQPVIIWQSTRLKAAVLLIASSSALTATRPPMFCLTRFLTRFWFKGRGSEPWAEIAICKYNNSNDRWYLRYMPHAQFLTL